MKKTIALWTLTLLVSLSTVAAAGEHANLSGHLRDLSLVPRMQAAPQAATGPQWKNRDEYDAYTAMATATDPDKKITLAEAFLQKFPTSDFKAGAYLTEMQVYFSQGKSDQGVDAAKKVLTVDPDNLDALAALSFVFPFTFKATDPDATAKLSRADSDAHHGLDVLQKLKKPDKVTDEQFKQYVTPKRALFNNTVGFVALQRKDYATAITAFKSAATDNPSDVYTFYRLGLAYMLSTPPDYDNGIWNLARAVGLAKAANAPDAAAIEKYFDQSFVSRHGSNAGEADVLTLAKTSVTPPDGFKVTAAEKHKPTGNQAIDYFYTLEDTMKAGGDQAKQAWDQTKGESFGYGGKVVSAEKGPDADTYLVGIAITDESKASDTADIFLRDKQPDAKYLAKGNLVASFKGTIADNTVTPSFSLTLVGTVDDDSLAAAKEEAQSKAKPKPGVHHTPVHKTTPPSN
jgi:tetratricopeptide (TPR) repeat protein